jgi:hypothetical protein
LIFLKKVFKLIHFPIKSHRESGGRDDGEGLRYDGLGRVAQVAVAGAGHAERTVVFGAFGFVLRGQDQTRIHVHLLPEEFLEPGVEARFPLEKFGF